jgi:Transcriptional regulator/sugar kinase
MGEINSIELKRINRNEIYNLIVKKDKISKQDIAYELKLSLPTVTQNLNELTEMGLIKESGTFESTGGRKAKIYTKIPTAKVAVGLDITKNNISLVMVDLEGNIINSLRKKMYLTDCEENYELLGNEVDQFIEQSKIDTNNILGIGITLPAIISPDRKVMHSASTLELSSDFYNKMNKYMKYPYSLYNDANGGGFAELWGNEYDKVVYIFISYTVGGAILFKDQLYYGDNQRSGEFGHMTIVPNGRACHCGKKGCADSYCSTHILSDSSEGNLDHFFMLLESGSKIHQNIWEEYLYYLSILINNLRMFFDCDIIIGGYLSKYIVRYIEELKILVSERNTFEKDSSYLKISKYGLEASAVGGALLYIDQFRRYI